MTIPQYAPPEPKQESSHQLGRGENHPIQTVAELKAQAKSGQPISLMDLAAAAKAEQHKDTVKQFPRNTPLSERVKRAREQAQKQQKQTKPSREQPKRNQMER